MSFAEEPERIMAEVERRQQEANRATDLARRALAGLQTEIVRVKRKKTDMLDLYLNQDRQGIVLTHEEYQAKARQLVTEQEGLEQQLLEMQERSDTPEIDLSQANEAVRLMKAIHAARQSATYEEKLAIIRLLDVRVLYDGERIELSGCVPLKHIVLENLRAIQLNLPDNPFPQPQSALGENSPEGLEDKAILLDPGRTTGYTHN